ncbi:hypothetical protein M0812_27544 [Anaeramoeba flamelloides]|uniref:Uncharacterized protein n=1 Tax=Anaeramoeba flamelloides TaxID=1746091 RepID=A0AAV7YAG0_9EUKA|nr:hypothetical protein M0812_27544 [Anaeramoeba flamelloides]
MPTGGIYESSSSEKVHSDKGILVFPYIPQHRYLKEEKMGREQESKLNEKITKQTIRVFHLNANPKSQPDVKESILCTGIVNYTFISAQKTTPDLETLKKYHVVWINSGSSFHNQTLIGDNLAQYVEAGGSVVVGGVHPLRNDQIGNWTIKGKFATGDYLPFKHGKLIQGKRCTLKAINAKGHIVMRGVKEFDGGEYSSHIETGLNSGAIPICTWSDNQVLIAEKPRKMGNTVIALNIRPESWNLNRSSWNINTDGRRLIGNSIEYAARMSKIKLK